MYMQRQCLKLTWHQYIQQAEGAPCCMVPTTACWLQNPGQKPLLPCLVALPIVSLCDIFIALHHLPFAGSTNGLCNHVTGTLPAAWGGDGAFSAMTVLELDITSMTGSLPSAWGGNHSFPALSDLLLTNDKDIVSKLSGTLPESWANPAAFPQLVTFGIGNCSINGMCSSVHALHKCQLLLLAFGAYARITHDCVHIAADCMLKCNCTIALACLP